jgi:quinohemoprotein ethanol dehydrogenase
MKSGKSYRHSWQRKQGNPKELAVDGCCDVVSRGVAAWRGKIFDATFDGRLVALDARTGKPVWTTMTVDKGKPYTITQAPRVVKGRVIIGTSGGEYGVRGYIWAYDAETGKLVWRFYTVPGDPSKPFENPAMAKADTTWSGEWWKQGGGGTVSDAISFDPDLILLYFGVGNDLEWPRGERSANKGDNLYLSSIVALDADTGAYAWHYQVMPGEEWDYDAVAQLTLANITMDGKVRHVLMQANKNGFFYVLDRRTGALISAKAIVPINWGSGIDIKTGRPIEHPNIRYSTTGRSVVMMPGPDGSHSRHPMAYNTTCRSSRSAKDGTICFASPRRSSKAGQPPTYSNASTPPPEVTASTGPAMPSGSCFEPCTCATTSRCRTSGARCNKCSSAASRYTPCSARSARRH